LFRHVCDLVEGQHTLGLKVGVVCDSSIGQGFAEPALAALEPLCVLGVHRLPMTRNMGWADARALGRLSRICRAYAPDIIHGHGAKGGAYARLLATQFGAKAIYTPHGGSLHYSTKSPAGIIYLTIERLLRARTDGIVFESQYGAEAYARKIGSVGSPYRIIHNGLKEEDFVPVAGSKDMDFVFVGELRKLKGIDVLLQALHRLKSKRTVSALIVGYGPDLKYLRHRIKELGLEGQVTILPPIVPARQVFTRARCVVLPSRAESFPYIVLEAAAAQVPVIATRVGGIPEIFGPDADQLVPPDDPIALAERMQEMLNDPGKAAQVVKRLHAYVKARFSADAMICSTLELYRQVLYGLHS